jgi:hypothetical protein
MALAEAAVFPHQEGRFSMTSSHTLDQLDTRFDDTHAIANAGLLLPARLARRRRSHERSCFLCRVQQRSQG